MRRGIDDPGSSAEIADRIRPITEVLHRWQTHIRSRSGRQLLKLHHLSFAFAVANDPAVLASVGHARTSALDGRDREATIILIAHRLSTIKAFDPIVFMQAGKIVDRGTFSGPCARNDLFHKIVDFLSVVSPEIGEEELQNDAINSR